jgi:hypothetical protein
MDSTIYSEILIPIHILLGNILRNHLVGLRSAPAFDISLSRPMQMDLEYGMRALASFCHETPARNGKTAPWRSRLSNKSRGIIAEFSEPRAQASGPYHLKAVS